MDCVVNIDGASKAYKKVKQDRIALQCKLLKTKKVPSNLTIKYLY